MTPQEILARQFNYLRLLKRMKLRRLLRKHDQVFAGTKYHVAIPTWMHRSVVERRLFYYFCLRHYHYPVTHPIYLEFRRKAKHVLSKEFLDTLDSVELTKEELKERELFNSIRIRSMSIVDVDRYLAGLGIFIEGSEEQRRKVLWEWYNRPSSLLIGQKKHRERQKRCRLNNRYSLRELIAKNPTLKYDDFIEAFGDEMPSVSRASFNNTRQLLRRVGFDIPVLPRGPSRPLVVTGPNGKLRRAETMLNDVTTTGLTEKDG